MADNHDGQIFSSVKEKEVEQVYKDAAPLIHNFIAGKNDPSKPEQLSLWPLYDFDFIPTELLSAIYENFLQAGDDKNKGEVYTPPFLVDEVMPLNMPREEYWKDGKIDYKVLDPSCGSGVFLVAAYKRLVQWWKIQNPDYQDQYKKQPLVFSNKLKEILEDNIYGVDVSGMASQISIFSLTIAYFELLDPKVFWEEFRFKDLSKKNIKKENFFKWKAESNIAPKLVIGNPPFNPPPSYGKSATRYVEKEISPFTKGEDGKIRIPDNLALHFLDHARRLNNGHQVCLVLPSAMLLYSPQKTSIDFRNKLIDETEVEKIFDFTHLRRNLFKKDSQSSESGSSPTEVAVCGLVLRNIEPDPKRQIEHVVVKRLSTYEKRIRFSIDHYDRHFVDKSDAKRYRFIWKCNLLGGKRLFNLIYRLSLLETLDDFIKERQEENGEWIFQVGYKSPISNPKPDQVNLHIWNRVKINDIAEGKIHCEARETRPAFARPRPAHLFQPPLVVLGKTSKRLADHMAFVASFDEDYLTFTDAFVGIHAPSGATNTLSQLFERLKSRQDLYHLWGIATSSGALVSQETALKKTDIADFPFPDFDEEYALELSQSEQVICDDVLNHYIHLGKSAKYKNDGFDALERPLSTVKPKYKSVLDAFGQTFCDTLNDIYAQNNKSWQIGTVYETEGQNGFILYQLGFGLNEATEQLGFDNEKLSKLVFDTHSNQAAIWIRTGRLYHHADGYDSVILIKPKNIRYWLRSVALRDADDTFHDLQREAKRRK